MYTTCSDIFYAVTQIFLFSCRGPYFIITKSNGKFNKLSPGVIKISIQLIVTEQLMIIKCKEAEMIWILRPDALHVYPKDDAR